MRRSLAIALVCSAIAAALTTASARPGRSLNKAAQIMARCVKKTRALRRFTCTMEVQILGMREPPPSKEKDQVVFDGPRRMAVRELSLAVTGPDGRDKEALDRWRYPAGGVCHRASRRRTAN